MIGPETTRPASPGSPAAPAIGLIATGVGAGTAVAAAAFVMLPVDTFSSPQPTARSATLNPIHFQPLRMPSPCSYQPSQYHIFAYTHKNGRRNNTYPDGYHPTRTFPRPSMPARIAPCSFGTATRA